MPRTDLSRISDEARLWVFGVSPALQAGQQQRVFERVDPFLDSWAAHGNPILAARGILHGSFLVIAVEKTAETSGCSIDRLFGTLKALEQQFGVAILDSNRVFFRDNGDVRAVPRADFRNAASLDSVVFDVTAQKLSDVRTGFEKAARDSWHRQLLA